jgi:anti-sigma-K factor RskA
MNDQPADHDQAFESLRSSARRLEDIDFARNEPPAGLWARISTEAMPVVAPQPSVRSRRSLWVLAAVAAAAAVLVGFSLRNGTQQQPLAAAALSNTDLSPRASGSSGDATLSRKGDSLILHIEVRNLQPEPVSYFELWMIDTSVQGMVSLGPFHGSGDYRVPDGIDAAKFPIVDISIEPADGTPTHSGESAVRGTLD